MSTIPAQYLQSEHAPAPRTLVDILYDTAARYPDAAAIDAGLDTVAAHYAEAGVPEDLALEDIHMQTEARLAEANLKAGTRGPAPRRPPPGAVVRPVPPPVPPRRIGEGETPYPHASQESERISDGRM